MRIGISIRKWCSVLLILTFTLTFSMVLIPLSYAAGFEPQISVESSIEGNTVTASVILSSDKKIGGIQFTLSYDSNLLKYESAVLQGSYRNMLNAMNANIPGQIIVAAASGTGVEPETVVFTAKFSVLENTSDVEFKLSEVVIADEAGDAYYSDGETSADVPSNNGQANQNGQGSEDEQSGQENQNDNDKVNENSNAGDSADENKSDSNNSTGNVEEPAGPDESGESVDSEESGAPVGDKTGTGNDSGASKPDTGSGTDPDVSENSGSDSESELKLFDEVFTDVSESWAYDYIKQAYENELMKGYGDGIFGPENTLTRAEMAQVLWNAAGNPAANTEAPFTDLTLEWYRDAINWAYENEIFNGVGNNLFDPEGTLTREQLAQILFNQSGRSSGMEAMLTNVYDNQYKDSSSISDWARSALYWSLYKEILCGCSSVEITDELNPQAPASRAQVAVMMVRYYESQAGNV